MQSRAPRGLMADALNATIVGLGRISINAHGMSFVVQRDDAALNAARTRYGDDFVNWVLERESTIIATLRQ